MSSVFTLREQAESAGKSVPRWTRPLLASLVAVAALVLLGRFVAEPLLTIRHVVVQSDIPLSDDQVLALSGIRGNEHWYSVATGALEKKLEENPLIRRAKVGKVFPDTVRMTVWGRQPAALVLAASGGRSMPVLVDGEGVVFKVGKTSAELDLPVVSGLAVGDTSLGARLPRAYLSLFSDLAALRDKSPPLFALVSEVRIVPSSNAGSADAAGNAAAVSPEDFDLLLYLTTAPIPVRVRGAVDESLVRYTLMAIDLLSKQGVLKDIQELDFRGGDLVYRTKGG